MKKTIRLFLLLLCIFTLLPGSEVWAKTPAIMASLKSHIQTYGDLTLNAGTGADVYTSKISYQKSKKRFLFQCNYTNGRSTSQVKMYMPIAKKQNYYTVDFAQTIRSGGLTAKLSGSAKLSRKGYSDQVSTLSFSRVNKTSAAKKITNSAYQSAGNSLLRIAFKMWEKSLETGATLCFRNFGFGNVTVIDGSRVYAYEW